MPAINVSVKPKIYNDLEEAVTRTGLTKSRITEYALEKYLQELEEDAADAAAAEAAVARFKASGEKAIPAAKVYKKLGL